MRAAVVLAALIAAAPQTILAVGTPPALIDYQGVLRDATNHPLSGSFDMTFRFHSAASGGDEILIDHHLAANAQAVTVTNGLFSVALGGGTISDGSGPGTYTGLHSVFAAYSAIWLSVQIGTETLSPRTQILSGGYALNARALLGKAATMYLDVDTATQTKTGALVLQPVSTAIALDARGATTGGKFTNQSGSATATLGDGSYGIIASGASAGGQFMDAADSGRVDLAVGDAGLYAHGNDFGGYFYDSNGTGEAYVGYTDYGILGQGGAGGGSFQASDGTGYASVGVPTGGIDAHGTEYGGRFTDVDSGSSARVGTGTSGIDANGTGAGGLFSESSGNSWATLAGAGIGIQAQGTNQAAHFIDANGSGEAVLGWGDTGVQGYGSNFAAYFADTDSSGIAHIGTGDRGIWARGNFAGGTFSHPNGTTFWADVATPTRKIQGTGTVSFVQNHPEHRDEVIVYAAPEGDEVAVYTRGSARLTNGEARVALGRTFRFVANPDLGLTAHLTSKGEPIALAVASLSTRELVVRGPAGSDAAFDYLVYGLRLGFEDAAVVQPKTREAFLPAAEAIAKERGGRDDMQGYTALARFQEMRGNLGLPPADLALGQALASAVNVGRSTAAEDAVPETAPPEAPVLARERRQGGSVERTLLPFWPCLPAAESLEPGDVVVLAPDCAGCLRAAARESDPAVAGCVVAPSEPGQVPAGYVALATSGIVSCRVDASSGPISVGDLLVASSTRGHAMRANEGAASGILGKAIDPLTEGTGPIRVLVSLR